MKNSKRTLRDRAIKIMKAEPHITVSEFATRLGKRYQHAASLMTFARQFLGQQTWEKPTKVDKMMAILSLGNKATGRQLQAWLEVSGGRAGELKSIARRRLATNRRPTSEAVEWAQRILGIFESESARPKIEKPTDLLHSIRTLTNEIRSVAPAHIPVNHRAVNDGHLLELTIPDLHLGRRSNPNETGESYDLEIACDLYRNAVVDLLTQAKRAYTIDQILLPIGSDFLTVDTLRNTTSRGTPQDVHGNFPEHLRAGTRLLRQTLETLRQVAPVQVLVIRGNHDGVASIAFGEILAAIYDASPDVTIKNECDLARKYVRYGRNLIGFAHGHAEKSRSLPMLMATEAAADWGQTKYREFHVGHFHHTRDVCYLGTNETDGVIVRVIPSLSAGDRWHAGKGYRAQRSALAYVYHRDDGQRAIFRTNADMPLMIQPTLLA